MTENLISIIEKFVFVAGTAVAVWSLGKTIAEIRRKTRTSLNVQVGDREYVYEHGMTSDEFAEVLTKDFDERPKNGRREAVHS